MCVRRCSTFFRYAFFFNDTAPTEIYTLSLHDALPISSGARQGRTGRDGVPRRPPARAQQRLGRRRAAAGGGGSDRKSTRLNSSHANISYAVLCLKKTECQISEDVKSCRQIYHNEIY